jgi:hypothetical protein
MNMLFDLQELDSAFTPHCAGFYDLGVDGILLFSVPESCLNFIVEFQYGIKNVPSDFIFDTFSFVASSTPFWNSVLNVFSCVSLFAFCAFTAINYLVFVVFKLKILC